jgi:8-oxo-dGTP pyrophosphatase MutT (NUDIX family)
MPDSAEPGRRLAAVVIPIFADPPHDVVFVERARHLRRHAGQIAFPGGALDEADGGDHARAAVRELHEEVGIPPDAVTIVGRLVPIVQTRNVFTVTPFVAVVDPAVPLVVDLNEASAAHRVPLAAILAPGAIRSSTKQFGDRMLETAVFDYGDMHVWGLTGNMLRNFCAAYCDDRDGLRTALLARLRKSA